MDEGTANTGFALQSILKDQHWEENGRFWPFIWAISW
jgi:hypothetical protein